MQPGVVAVHHRFNLQAALAVLALSLALFFPALLLHELLHLAVLRGLGGDGALILRPWRFALFDGQLPSLHLQPARPLGGGAQLAVNFLGPGLAALLFAVAGWRIRPGRLRTAVLVNVAILAFYALIEAGDVVLERALGTELSLLAAEEFNYGVPLFLCLLAGLLTGLGQVCRPLRMGT